MAVANCFDIEINGKESYVKVPIEEFNRMQTDQEWLSCLEEAGVDNWGGIEEAYKIHYQREE